MNPLAEFDSRNAFRICLVLLENINTYLFDDYPVDAGLTNHGIIGKFIPKTRIAKLRGNLRSDLKFMKKLIDQKDTDYETIIKRKNILAKWHEYLTHLHMFHYSRNNYNAWNPIGLAIHQLLDAHYHIYTKLTASQEKAICFWCDTNLSIPWKDVLSNVITNNLPKIYTYLHMAHLEVQGSEFTEDALSECFGNIKLLLRQSIK